MTTELIKLKLKLSEVVQITFAWILVGVFLAVFEHVISGTSLYIRSKQYSFCNNLSVNFYATIIGGLSIGALEIFYLRERFKQYLFVHVLLLKSIIYLTSIFLISSLVYLSFYYWALPFPELIRKEWDFLTSFDFIKYVISWGMVVIATLFVIQIRDKFGQGVLGEYLLGKYHHPKEEERIFMFLDLKSSTQTAEALGHVDYFKFLKDFYSDITYPIIDNKGEIYQYVGDEIVVSWKKHLGLKNAQAIQTFFDIDRTLSGLSSKYLYEYGIVPEFKAAFHIGRVTTGEVGIIKKDLVFTGDVLNTTSRIQQLCNRYQRRLLVSAELKEQLPAKSNLLSEKIGEVYLRGKAQSIILYAISKPFINNKYDE